MDSYYIIKLCSTVNLHNLIIIEETAGMPHLKAQEVTLLVYYCNFCLFIDPFIPQTSYIFFFGEAVLDFFHANFKRYYGE